MENKLILNKINKNMTKKYLVTLLVLVFIIGALFFVSEEPIVNAFGENIETTQVEVIKKGDTLKKQFYHFEIDFENMYPLSTYVYEEKKGETKDLSYYVALLLPDVSRIMVMEIPANYKNIEEMKEVVGYFTSQDNIAYPGIVEELKEAGWTDENIENMVATKMFTVVSPNKTLARLRVLGMVVLIVIILILFVLLIKQAVSKGGVKKLSKRIESFPNAYILERELAGITEENISGSFAATEHFIIQLNFSAYIWEKEGILIVYPETRKYSRIHILSKNQKFVSIQMVSKKELTRSMAFFKEQLPNAFIGYSEEALHQYKTDEMAFEQWLRQQKIKEQSDESLTNVSVSEGENISNREDD